MDSVYCVSKWSATNIYISGEVGSTAIIHTKGQNAVFCDDSSDICQRWHRLYASLTKSGSKVTGEGWIEQHHIYAQVCIIILMNEDFTWAGVKPHECTNLYSPMNSASLTFGHLLMMPSWASSSYNDSMVLSGVRSFSFFPFLPFLPFFYRHNYYVY